MVDEYGKVKTIKGDKRNVFPFNIKKTVPPPPPPMLTPSQQQAQPGMWDGIHANE